jgi:hypothetical protein
MMAAQIKDENNDRAFASDEKIDMQAGVAFAAEGGTQYKEEHDGREYSGSTKKGSLRPRADEAAVQMTETKLLKYRRAWSDYKTVPSLTVNKVHCLTG